MKKIGGIIFCRMNSRRLPGKALKLLDGKSLLKRVIDASLNIKNINHVCVATSQNKEDDKIETFAKSCGIDVFRGSENNVLSRALNASNKFGYNSFARICGDRPFINSKIYDELIIKHLSSNADITSNIFPRVVPYGLSAEIISVNALNKINLITTEKSDREHITKYFYNNANKFIIENMSHKNIYKKHINTRLVVDNQNDLQRAIWIIKTHQKKNINLSSESIIEMANQWELNYSINNLNSKQII